MSDMTSPTSQVAALISRGKEQGYLTFAEVNDHLPDSITESEQIEDIIQMLQDVGIPVHERAPESDDTMFDGSNTETTDEVSSKISAKESLEKRRLIDDLLAQRRLERELKDFDYDLDDDDDFDDEED
jgi:molybdopterin converting factor small subunit